MVSMDVRIMELVFRIEHCSTDGVFMYWSSSLVVVFHSLAIRHRESLLISPFVFFTVALWLSRAKAVKRGWIPGVILNRTYRYDILFMA